MAALVASNHASGSQGLSQHTANADIHVTKAEKDTWNKGPEIIIGSYIGNGTSAQTITLGYKPKLGIVFTPGDGVGRVSWGVEQYHGNTGFMCDEGSTFGLEPTSTGFIAKYSPMGGIDGFTVLFNANGIKYVYILWK